MIEEEQVESLPLDDKIRAPISPIVHDKVLDLIVQYLGKNSEILDLGAGEGEFSRRLIEKDFWKNSVVVLGTSLIFNRFTFVFSGCR